MLNPFLSRTAYKTVTSLTVVAMLTSIIISQTHRSVTNLTKLVLLLRQVKSSTQVKAQKRLRQEISLDALRNNRSMCHQMIMGSGKTTVVAPLFDEEEVCRRCQKTWGGIILAMRRCLLTCARKLPLLTKMTSNLSSAK
jgi:hypothetical protein